MMVYIVCAFYCEETGIGTTEEIRIEGVYATEELAQTAINNRNDHRGYIEPWEVQS
jgi:hypothetical protein